MRRSNARTEVKRNTQYAIRNSPSGHPHQCVRPSRITIHASRFTHHVSRITSHDSRFNLHRQSPVYVQYVPGNVIGQRGGEVQHGVRYILRFGGTAEGDGIEHLLAHILGE